jgi:sarcosine oxidase delta subunit
MAIQTVQCPHCGDVFDLETFDAHAEQVARRATTLDIEKWLWALARAEVVLWEEMES